MFTLNKLKRLIILVLTVIALTYVWNYLIRYRPWDIRFPVKKNISSADYEFHKARVREISGELSYFDIKANKVEIFKNNTIFKNVSGNMLSKNIPVLFFQTDTLLLNLNNQQASLTNIFAYSIKPAYKIVRRRKIEELAPAWQIRSPYGYWNHQLNTLIMEKPLKVWKDDTVITTDRLTYYSQYQFFIFSPNCEFKNKDFHVNCKKGTLKEKIQTLTLENNVTFQGPDFNGRADLIEVNYESNECLFKNNVIIEYENAAINTNYAASKLNSNIIDFSDGVKFAYKNTLVQSNKAQLNRDIKTITFSENIKALQDQTALEGEKIIYDLKDKKFVSTGGRTKFIKTKNGE